MELYHILNRGVDKRHIFMDDSDRFRFVHDLYEFNDLNWASTTSNLLFQKHAANNFEHDDIASRHVWRKDNRKRHLLVNIHAFCLMSNHFHLLLSPREENGISVFMKKLDMGYAKYFNQKYNRTGALFEGRYKSVPVTTHAHLLHLPYYIHLNPLDVISPEWRDCQINNYKKTIKFLETYRWSSFLDYTGKKNFPSVTYRHFLLKFFNGPAQYRKETYNWLKNIDLGDMKTILLE